VFWYDFVNLGFFFFFGDLDRFLGIIFLFSEIILLIVFLKMWPWLVCDFAYWFFWNLGFELVPESILVSLNFDV
jgi:hypothetical protein